MKAAKVCVFVYMRIGSKKAANRVVMVAVALMATTAATVVKEIWDERNLQKIVGESNR